MRPESLLTAGPRSGAKPKVALYRETLQTTGFYVGRIVIVPGEFAPISSPPRRGRGFREPSGFLECVFQGRRNLSVRWGLKSKVKNKTISTWEWGAASRWSAPKPQ